MIDGQAPFDKSVKNNLITCDSIRKVTADVINFTL